MKDVTTENPSVHTEQPVTESRSDKKPRPGIKIRTRIKAGLTDSSDDQPTMNHSVKLNDVTTEEHSVRAEQPAAETHSEKKPRPGIKIRTRIKAGDCDYAFPTMNHSLALRVR